MIDTTANVVNDWLIGYPPVTAKEYRRNFDRFVAFLGNTDPLEADRALIQRFLATLTNKEQLTPATVRRYASAVTSFYTYAVQEKLLEHNPAANVRRPKGASEAKLGLPADQARSLIAAAQAHSKSAHALIWLMAGAGLRVNEAVSANIEDLRDGVLTVTVKGGHRQTKPLSNHTLDAVLTAIGSRTTGPIVTNRDGQRLSRQRAWELTERLATSVGIKHCSPHTLRHTAATLALEAGAPVQAVQQLLGHRSIETTLRYIQGRDIASEIRAAADLLDNVLNPEVAQ